MSSNFIVFFPSAVPGLVFSFTWSGSEKKQAGTVKGTERSRRMGGRARVAAWCVTNRFWFMVWRDTGASARATAGAAAKRRPPGGGEVEEDGEAYECWKLGMVIRLGQYR